MPKFPVDAPIDKVIKALEHIGFQLSVKATTSQWCEKILMELDRH